MAIDAPSSGSKKQQKFEVEKGSDIYKKIA
jgi:hypothetical protein